MGDFYGYDPARFVMPDRYGIGAASQAASNTVMNVSGAVADKKAAAAAEAEKREKIRLAAEAAKKDWGAMSTTYSGIGKSIKNKAQSLVDSGAMTQAEADQMIDMYSNFRPTSIHQKDPEKYLTGLGTTMANIYDTLNKKAEAFQGQRRQGDVIGAVGKGIGGTPGTEAVPEQTRIIPEIIPTGQWAGVERPTRNSWGDEETQTTPAVPATPATPPAESQLQGYQQTQEVARDRNINSITAKEYEEAGGKYLPTEEDLAKRKREEEKLDIQKIKVSLSRDKESNINWYREEMIKLKNAADDLSRAKARTSLDRFDVAVGSEIIDTEEKITGLKNKKDDLGQPVPVDSIELSKLQNHLDELKLIKSQTIGDAKLQTIRRNVKTGGRGGYGETPSSIPLRDRPLQPQPSYAPKKIKIGRFEVEEE